MVRAFVVDDLDVRLVVDVAVGAFGVAPTAPVAALTAAFLTASTPVSAAMVTIIDRRFPALVFPFFVSIKRLNPFPVILFAALLRYGISTGNMIVPMIVLVMVLVVLYHLLNESRSQLARVF